MSAYNATVRRLDALTGQELGLFVAEVDDAGRILRSNYLQFTGLEGTPRYDDYLRRCGHRFEVLRDGGAAFQARLYGLPLRSDRGAAG